MSTFVLMVERRESQRPRDRAIRAALRDAARLASMVEPELLSEYRGEEQDAYLRVLAEYVADLGGRLDVGVEPPIAQFGERRIAVVLHRS